MEATVETKTKWAFDPAHSELVFKVKHLMITNVNGSFGKFNVMVNGDDFSTAEIKAIIDTSSVTTNESSRDAHLKGADFFDVENYNEIVFEKTSYEKKDAENHVMKGMLTIKGISKEVTLNVEFGGISKDPWGNEKAGFSLSGKINRKDWGLTWNAALESGGMLVSDEVKINAEVQFVKQSQ